MTFKSKYLTKNKLPYFISEIGINHNGFLNLALKMIKYSKKAGFNAVKFQKKRHSRYYKFWFVAKKI